MKLMSVLTVVFLVIGVLFGFLLLESQVVIAQDIIYVGSGIGNDSTTIQGGINLANIGDTVFVYSGIYTENVLVDKSINLTGQDNKTTIIDGQATGDGVYVTSDWVNITGFTVTNGDYGIHLDSTSNNMIMNNIVHSNADEGMFLFSSSNNIITNNNLSQNYYGIHIRESSNNNTVVNNIVWNNSINGIYLSKLSYNQIINNRISHNGGNGIFLFTALNNTLKANDISNNSHGIYFTSSSRNNTLMDNRITNNDYGIYFGLSWNNTIKDNEILYSTWHGLRISSSSTNNTVTNNNISFNGRHGIMLSLTSTSNYISHNRISNNADGFNLSSSSNNTILHNDISSNFNIGIYLSSSLNCTILNNTVLNNLIGIYLTDSVNNSVFHNNIIDNSNQAYDDASFNNDWDGGYPLSGNFWSDWTEPDNLKGPSQNITGSDGIVDNPYEIDMDSKDNYPLIKAKETTPPQITNLQPPNSSIINTSFPTIEAEFTDDSGINSSSAVLEVNGIEVTPFSNITARNITYTTVSPLDEGSNAINFWIEDYWGNLAFVSWSFEIDTTPPGAITDLTAINPTSNSISLTWNAPGDDGSTGFALGYIIKYSGTGPISSSNWADATTYSQSWVPREAGEIETHVISGLNLGTQYWFAIIAYDELHNHADISNSPSGITQNIPSAPQNPQKYPGNVFVNITWQTPISDGGSPITNYKIYKGTTSGGESLHAEIENIRFYNDSNVTNGITYYYRVAAKNIVGEGPLSTEVNATPATFPSEPTNLRIESGDHIINITWDTPVSNGGSPIIKYIIYRGASAPELAFFSEIDVTSFYIDTNVTNGITYYYRVAAKNKAGEGLQSNEVNATPSTVPSAPTDLSATTGDSYVHLFWASPFSDGGSSITNYIIYRATISNYPSILIEVGNILQYNDTTVENNISYYYKVSAKNAIGEGSKSHEIDATPQSPTILPEDETTKEEDETPWLLIGIAAIIALIFIVLILGFAIRKREGNQPSSDSLPSDEEIINDDVGDELAEEEESGEDKFDEEELNEEELGEEGMLGSEEELIEQEESGEQELGDPE
jgi:parallel beta-helix repeat protein